MTTQIPAITPEQLHAAQQGIDWHSRDLGQRNPLVRYGQAGCAHTLEQA